MVVVVALLPCLLIICFWVGPLYGPGCRWSAACCFGGLGQGSFMASNSIPTLSRKRKSTGLHGKQIK